MANEIDPRIDQWYSHLDKGQSFYVIAINKEDKTIDIQHYDGDLEEISFAEWRGLNLELSEEPENWTGALDISEKDDRGTEITDTSGADWNEEGKDYRRSDT